MKKILQKLNYLGIMLLVQLSSIKLAYADAETDAAANAAGDVGPTTPPPAGTDLSTLDQETGVRINNAFKPINAPDAINQNYTSDTVNAFLQFLAGSIIELTAGVAIFVLVIAGYMFVTAGGDQGRIDKAKEIVKYTIFGILMVILSFVIVKTIISLVIDVDTF